MRFLSSLRIGDKFRPAYPTQPSLNNRILKIENFYVLKKVFSQSPYTHICVRDKKEQDGFYSLPPKVPVLNRGEPRPSPEKVLQFLSPRPRTRIYGYKMLWNGDKADLLLLNNTVQKLLQIMFIIGQREFEINDLIRLVKENYTPILKESEPKNVAMFVTYHARTLARLGFLEQIIAEAPVPEEIVEANLHEVI